MTMFSYAGVGALWRLAVKAFAQAFDPAREAGEDTVFQPGAARKRSQAALADASPGARRPQKETLQ